MTIGDLEDLERQARCAQAQLLVTNSHGAEIAARLGLPLLRVGFPLYDQAGAQARQWIGYRGSRQTVFELANLLTAHYREIPPYRSMFGKAGPAQPRSGPPCQSSMTIAERADDPGSIRVQ